MSSRRSCPGCKKNFGKSSYYLHLPCSLVDISVESSTVYVFCDHCNQRVARKTYTEHQRIRNIAGTFNTSSEVFESQTSVDGGETVIQDEIPVSCFEDFEHDRSSSEDIDSEGEVHHQNEEDQAFYSESEATEDDRESDDHHTADSNDPEINQINSESGIQEEEVVSSEEDNEVDGHNSNVNSSTGVSSESKAILMFLLLWQTIYKVSDNGIAVLLKFFKQFLITIGNLARIGVLINFAKSLPSTLYMAKVTLGLEKDDFQKFVTCPKCMTLYKLDECTATKSNGIVVSKKCTYVRFPNHPQRRRRTECGAFLMKKVRTKSGSVHLQPKRIYCFRPLISSLTTLLSKPGFAEKCEDWRKRNLEEGKMGDVYEGRIWREFMDTDGKQYFSSVGNLAVMLNVDWFQPYKHISYSCGVMYLVLMNLPREERFKVENVIIVGIIPGPNEPKGNMNSFLQPFVDELIDLWDGVILDENKIGISKIRVALLALCCDIPAARKCGGFAGHSAIKGCNKCFKTFPREGFGSKPDFSGFNVDQWERRTNDLHRIHAEQTLSAKSPAKLKEVIRNTGTRYSSLLQLPYYDAIRYVVIDPMHNLFLGIAKHTMKVWKERGALSDKDLQIIQKRVNAVEPPSETGRIPSKIATGFGGFTADQWKNWVCYYSLFALKRILPNKDYAIWTHFVNACRLICCYQVTEEHCTLAEAEILKFCKAFEKLYGKDKCTPNMHLSCHLVECIRDYGPVYSFWCFSFERYNGILGSYPKGSQNIGIQLMRKFLKDLQLKQMEWPEDFKSFDDLLSSSDVGTVGEVCKSITDDIVRFPPIKRISIDSDDVACLSEVYQNMYSDQIIDNILRISESFQRIQLNNRVIKSSSTMGVFVNSSDNELRPAQVIRFLTNDAILSKDGKKKKVSNIMAEITYFKPHPERNWYPAPMEVWSTDIESWEFVPVASICRQFMCVKYKVKFGYGIETVLVVIPLVGRFC